jgi:hypothetical protein
MKKLMVALVLMVITGVVEAKGSTAIAHAGIAHATVASHMVVHNVSGQTNSTTTGEKLSDKASTTITVALISLIAIGISAMAGYSE